MALFLARSALCIGAVAVAASGFGPVPDTLPERARGAADAAARACLASSACLRFVGAAGAASVSAPPIPTAQTAGAAPRVTGATKMRPLGAPRR